jgi:hypothetical protein
MIKLSQRRVVLSHRNLRLGIIKLFQVHSNELLCQQIDLVVHRLCLQLHVVQLKQNLLVSFMAFYKNLTNQHLEVPIDINSLQVLRLFGPHGARVRDPRVGAIHHLSVWNEVPKNPYVSLGQVNFCPCCMINR